MADITASTIHSNARTTPQIRRELQEAPPGVSDPELARRYGITQMTVRKWRYRNDVEDRSHHPQTLHTTLTPEQEATVVQVWKVALLSLDDLLIVAREFLNPELTRGALDRCLRRHGVGNRRALQRERDGEPEDPAHKPFKDYVPGFVHVDVSTCRKWRISLPAGICWSPSTGPAGGSTWRSGDLGAPKQPTAF